MKKSPCTVIYIPEYQECPLSRIRAKTFKQIVEDNNGHFIPVDFNQNDSYDQMISDALSRCQDRKHISGPLMVIGSGRGAYIGASVQLALSKDGYIVSSFMMLSPEIEHHDPNTDSSFPPNLADKTIVVHGYDDEINHPLPTQEYCSEYGIQLHQFKDDHDLQEGFPFACDLLEQELKRIGERDNTRPSFLERFSIHGSGAKLRSSVSDCNSKAQDEDDDYVPWYED